MRARWKSMLSDSFIQLAVILSILRTDLRIYLRQYSQYPEVQQALLGQSVGLHLVDNYHNNAHLPLPPSKYIDDSEHIFHELHRLVESSQVFQQQTQTVSTWLVTDNTAAHSVTAAAHPVSSGGSPVELSQQDVELIELLWKEDVESFVSRAQLSVKERRNTTDGQVTDQGIEENPPSFSDSGNDQGRVPWSRHSGNDTQFQERPPYNAQNSLDLALQDLVPPMEEFEGAGATATNSSMLYPNEYPTQISESWDGIRNANGSGVLWGNVEPYQLPGHNSSMDFESSTNEESSDLMFPLLGELDLSPDDMGIGFDFNAADDMLASLNGDEDDVSVDSAMGSSPSHSWYNGTSTTGSERHSISSTDPFDLEDGAVGYTKTEPYDNKYYEAPRRTSKHNNGAVSHNHTYGAPPGGVPHVRKMDIKTTKEPSRGLAHDEVLCKKFKIPFTVDQIINSPVDEFNSLLQTHKLTSRQITLVKDIRRRGKNKVAAQNCRQKRVGEYSELEGEVEQLRSRRSSLYQKHTILLNKSTEARKHIDIMSAEIFRTLRDENGMPYNTSQFSLEVGRDGEIQVTSTERTQRSRGSRKRDSSKRRR